MTLRIAFMGTPDFSVAALAALIAAGQEVACVYTQPPRPAGRGKEDRPSPVHEFAAGRGIEVRHPEPMRDEDEQEAPRHGCINIHASLLPRWRGAAPVQRAILAADRISGVTIMRMDAGLDTGPMLMKESVTIGPKSNAGWLHDELSAMGARMIVEALARLEAGRLEETPQGSEGVTYAAKIDKAETRIDWTRPAAGIERQLRAFAPAPGAWFELEDERIRVLAGTVTGDRGEPGTVLDDRLTVACGEGAIRLEVVQRAGKGAMEAAAFLRGRAVPVGTVLA
jgi:methionyl-tRNA formyltransferase